MSRQNRRRTFGRDAWRRSPVIHNRRVAWQRRERWARQQLLEEIARIYIVPWRFLTRKGGRRNGR